jgi:cytochrome c oxidase cbb3-type subunit III
MFVVFLRIFQHVMLCVGVLLLLPACEGRNQQRTDGGNAPAPVVDSGAEPEPIVPEEEQMYLQYCAHCHATDGQGYTADNANALANPKFLAVATDDFLRDAIRYGRPGTPMSAWGVDFGGPLTDEAIDKIIFHLRSWQTADPVDVHEEVITGDVASGETVYTDRCLSCHGEDGKGNTAISLTNPWFLKTASDGFLRYATAEGRSPTAMIGYADLLSDQELFDVVSYLRDFEVPIEPEPLPPFTPDLTDILINADGPDAEFVRTDDRFVAADDVLEAMESGQRLILLDARPSSDYLTSHIEGSVSLPFFDVPDALEHLPTDDYIISYCGCPHALSGEIFDYLSEAGYTKIGVLDEGYYYWEDNNYPIARGRNRYEEEGE